MPFLVKAYQSEIDGFNWEEISNSYSIRNFTVKDGLPLNAVNYISHAAGDYLYLATNDGLTRFDGRDFYTYNTFNSDQLQSNRISWVASILGEVWFRDQSRNLYRLVDGELLWIQSLAGLEDHQVYKVAQLSNSEIIITTNKGFLIFEKGSSSPRTFADDRTKTSFENSFTFGADSVFFVNETGLYQIKNQTVHRVFEAAEFTVPVSSFFNMVLAKDRSIWLLGSNGTLTGIEGNEAPITYRIPNASGIELRDMIEVSATEFLVSTNKGYYRFDRTLNQFFPTNQLADSEPYFEDNAWNQKNDFKLTVFRNTVFIDNKEILKAPREITFLTKDHEGSIWVATNGAGLYQIVKDKMVTIGKNYHPALENTYGIAEKNGEVFVTAFQNYLFQFSNEGITHLNPESAGFSSPYFRSVVITSKEDVYAGSFDLWKKSAEDWQRIPTFSGTSELINALFEDQEHTIWVGTDKGLYQEVDGERLPFFDSNGVGLSAITNIKQTYTGELLVTTTAQGIARLTHQGIFSFKDTEAGLSSNLVRDVHFSASDTLWVALEDKGMNRLILSEDREVLEVREINSNDGLFDNSLHRIIEDEFGFFWINSNKGIMRISKAGLNAYLETGNELIVQHFGEDDGLINIEGNGGVQSAGVILNTGDLLFPNQAGIIYTRPSWHIEHENNQMSPPIIEELTFENESRKIRFLDEIKLPQSIRELSIYFTIPTFSAPEKIELDYKLEGVNQYWIDAAEERKALFSNIPSGVHTFKVRARMNGNERYSTTSISIEVPPYFYETNWFAGLLFIGFGLVFVGGFRVLLNQSIKREQRLNALVAERTKDMLHEKEKTEQALKQVEALSESKSRFFTNFTHELRTPLSLILNPLDDILAKEQLSPQTDEKSLLLIRRNAKRLKELVNTLLDVSKINSDEFTLSYQPVYIYKITKQIVAQFEHEFDKKNITCMIESADEHTISYVDVNAWDHICTNLVSNALKFSEEGERITIRFNQEQDGLHISFQDTGVGIPANELPFIFDSYYQVDSLVNRAGGTGIGLTLVKGLVEQMKGAISVKSKPKKGSTFTIILRQGKDHIPDEKIKATEIVSEIPVVHELKEFEELPKSTHNNGSIRVLLVEDNDDMRDYLATIIGAEYEIQTAHNGKEGLKLLDEFQPEIIVSDIMMPELDGIEMMKRIRAIDKFTHIPFIFLTAKDSASDIEKGLNLGADIYLTKPVENNLLLLQIKVLLRRESALEIEQDHKKQPALVLKINEVIQRHLGNPDLNVELLAEALNMSVSTLYRKWKAISDVTINKTIAKHRFEEASKLIKEEGFTISEAAYSVGFRHLSYFSSAFKKEFGESPQEYFKN